MAHLKIQVPQNLLNAADDTIEENDPMMIEQNNNEINNKEKEKINMDEINSDMDPWNGRIVLFLIKIRKKTVAYRWMHDRETVKFENSLARYKWIDLIFLAFASVLTGGEFITLLFHTGLDSNEAALITISCVQLVIIFFYTIFKGMRENSEFEKNIFNHNYISSKFGELNLNIQNQLSINIDDREKDRDFLKNTIKSFNDLLYLAPKIRIETKSEYIENSEENDVFNPITDNHGNIQIVIQHDEHKPDQDKNNTQNQQVAKKVDLQSKYQFDRWLNHLNI